MVGIFKFFTTILVCGLVVYPLPSVAKEPSFLTFSIGYFDLVQDHNQASEFRFEYRSDKKLSFFKPFVGLMGTNNSSFYGYGGFLLDLFYGRRWVVTPSLAAGYYEKGSGLDLGYEIEFRSSVEISYRFDNRSRLGFSFYHLSNASISNTNPGTEVLSVVYSFPLGSGSEPSKQHNSGLHNPS